MTESSFRTRMVTNARSALSHPAARLLVVLYILSIVLLLAASGNMTIVVIQLGLTALTLLTALVAVSLTAQPPVAWETPPTPSHSRLWLQLAVVALVIAYTLFRAQVWRSPELENLPILGEITGALNDLPFNIVNPLLYVLIPLVLLLLLGARPGELGLSLPRTGADWRRIGILILVMAFINLGYIIVSLLFGGLTPEILGRGLVIHTLQNGFAEEFLMRGALMTRLIRLTDAGWGIVISSLIFGLWHVSANLPMFDGNILAALAFSIVSQGMMGIGFAVAMQRGGNLVAPSVNHVLSHFNPF